jgi:hypothetical protein
VRRFLLLALVSWWGIQAFCQSTAISPGNAQIYADKPTAPQSQFNFSGKFGTVCPAANSKNMNSCYSLNADEYQASDRAAMNQISHVPCPAMSTLLEMAYLAAKRPKVSAQIPTQWPKAKIEPIPMIWPDSKLVLIASISAPAK